APDPDSRQSYAQAAADDAVRLSGAQVEFVFGILPGYSARLSPEALAAVSADPRVRSVTPDHCAWPATPPPPEPVVNAPPRKPLRLLLSAPHRVSLVGVRRHGLAIRLTASRVGLVT